MKDTNISPSRLKEFCDTIIMQAREVLYEREDDILKAWHENIEEAQASGKDFPPLKLGLGATIDLESNTIETTLRFTAVYQSKLSTEIPDPDQAEFPGMSREDTMKSAVKEASMGGKLAKALTKGLRGVSVSVAVDGETVYDATNDDLDTTEPTTTTEADDGPRIVDVEEANGYEADMQVDAQDAAKVLVGKSSKDKKHAAIDKIGIDWGAPGLKAVMMHGGDKIPPVFRHHIEGLIVDIEMREAEESQPEGESDY